MTGLLRVPDNPLRCAHTSSNPWRTLCEVHTDVHTLSGNHWYMGPLEGMRKLLESTVAIPSGVGMKRWLSSKECSPVNFVLAEDQSAVPRTQHVVHNCL